MDIEEYYIRPHDTTIGKTQTKAKAAKQNNIMKLFLLKLTGLVLAAASAAQLAADAAARLLPVLLLAGRSRHAAHRGGESRRGRRSRGEGACGRGGAAAGVRASGGVRPAGPNTVRTNAGSRSQTVRRPSHKLVDAYEPHISPQTLVKTYIIA